MNLLSLAPVIPLSFQAAFVNSRSLMLANTGAINKTTSSNFLAKLPAQGYEASIDNYVDQITSEINGGSIYKNWFKNLLTIFQKYYKTTNFEHAINDITCVLMQGQRNASTAPDDCLLYEQETTPLTDTVYRRSAVYHPLLVMAESLLLKTLPSQAQTREVMLLSKASFKKNEGITIESTKQLSEEILKTEKPIYIQSINLQISGINDSSYLTKESAKTRGRLLPIRKCAQTCAAYITTALVKGNEVEAVNIINNAIENKIGTTATGALKQAITHLCHQPIMQVQPQDRENQLTTSWKKLANLFSTDNFVATNINYLKSLFGEQITLLFPLGNSETFIKETTDLLTHLYKIFKKKSLSENDYIQGYSMLQRLTEISIHQLERQENLPTLKEVLHNVFSNYGLTVADVHTSAYANTLLSAITDCIGDISNVALLPSSYFESQALLQGAENVSSTKDPHLLNKSIIFFEPTTNSPEASLKHDGSELINYLFKENPTKDRTLIVDISSCRITDPTIKKTITTAKPHVESGKLNLILLRSHTKRDQMGMDSCSAGSTIYFNNHDNKWQYLDPTPEIELDKTTSIHFAKMIKDCKLGQSQYNHLNALNAQALRKALEEGLQFTPLQVHLSQDQDDILTFISFANNTFANDYAVEETGKPIATVLNDQKALEKLVTGVKRELATTFRERKLPVIEQASFGTQMTSFCQCGSAIRFSSGIENPKVIQQYAEAIIDTAKTLSEPPQYMQNCAINYY